MKTVFKRLKKTVMHRYMEMFVLCVFAVVVCFSCLTTAKTTYVINDGEETVVIESVPNDTERAIAEAGITLDEIDSYVTSESDDNGVKIEIIRPNEVYVKYHGITEKISTQSKTVGQLLREEGISIAQGDRLSYRLNEKIEDNMRISIQKVETVYETVTEPIEYETIYAESPAVSVGSEKVIREGINGEKEVTYVKQLVDGVVEEKRVESETVITEPVPKVIVHSRSDSNALKMDKNYVAAHNGEVYEYTNVISMIATAYTHSGNLTATGVPARVGIVAADTSVLPFGTVVYITAADGSWTYGYAVVGDTGVSGKILDLFMDTYDECIQFGARNALVYVIG